MPTHRGPRFALHVRIPREWNLNTYSEDEVFVVDSESPSTAYRVEVPSDHFREFLKSHTHEPLWIFLAEVQKEDGDRWIAFQTPQEVALFWELLNVDSIGPKSAALLVGGLGVSALSSCLHSKEYRKTVKLSGFGPKSFEKLFDAFDKKGDVYKKILGASSSGTDSINPLLSGALEKLGLKPRDVQDLVNEVQLEFGDLFMNSSDSDKVKLLLQRWGHRRGRN